MNDADFVCPGCNLNELLAFECKEKTVDESLPSLSEEGDLDHE